MNKWPLLILAALAMSVGWGFRGDYGHEAGAMVPGALLALALCLAAGRPDWWRRAALLAFCGALGWAFGGQMSYGRIIGYTAHSSYTDVAYGYACLFLIGALWGGTGAAVLALGLTRSRSFLERFVGPLLALWLVWLILDLSGLTEYLSDRWSLYDSDWVAAASAALLAALYALFVPRARPACGLLLILAGGWGLGFALLSGLLDLHMTPPRSDNWSGCVGLFFFLLLYLWRTRNCAALLLVLYGFCAGGLGFLLGDFINMLGRAQWGPIGRYPALQNLDYWKWMEQSFGLIMGLGVALGARRLLQKNLAPPTEDHPSGRLSTIALLFLLIVMPFENLFKNVRNWNKAGALPDQFWHTSPAWWILLIALLLALTFFLAIFRHHRRTLPLAPAHPFGRAQLLFLLILWIALAGCLTQAFPHLKHKGVFFVQLTFWLTGALCSLIVIALTGKPDPILPSPLPPQDTTWRPRPRALLLLILLPLLILLVAWLSIASHADPLPGSHLRFP